MTGFSFLDGQSLKLKIVPLGFTEGNMLQSVLLHTQCWSSSNEERHICTFYYH